MTFSDAPSSYPDRGDDGVQKGHVEQVEIRTSVQPLHSQIDADLDI